MLSRAFLRLHLLRRAMSEAEKAQHAQPPAENEDTLFDKIVRREIPSTVVFEDERVMAFRDINPTAPTHIVLIPKNRDGLTQLSLAQERHRDLLGHLMWAAAEVARLENLAEGWRLVVNNGVHGCQSVYHLHLHIIGGRQLTWPPG